MVMVNKAITLSQKLLKTNGNLSKDNMCQLMSNIIDISKTNGKGK